MKLNRVKRVAGFTLVESCVVIGLLGTMLLISIYRFPSRQQEILNEQMFWEQFNTVWQQAVFEASAKHQSWNIFFDGHPKQVSFERRVGKYQPVTYQINIPIPKTLTFPAPEKGYLTIDEHGHPSLRKITVTSTLSNKKVVISTQMGWGTYHTKIVA